MNRLHRVLICSLILSSVSWAAEESLNLDEVSTPAVAAPKDKKHSELKIMGRLDLTYEYGNPSPNSDPNGSSRSTLENNHMLVFLKIKASEKTGIMAEVINQKFFYAEYTGSLADVQLGKILVPFGDNRRFHLLYGGIQGYGATGVMFQNVWAEPGLNINWKLPLGSLDTYVVNAIPAADATKDPNFQGASDSAKQAGGLRYTATVASGMNVIASAYAGEYWHGRTLSIYGLDFYTDYGATSFLKSFRLAMGRAEAFIVNAPVSDDYKKAGDYVEVSTNLIGPGETRLRYGTYIDNSSVITNKDVHNWNLGYSFPVDAFNVLVEHQLNMEAVNEIKNDLTRVMVSINF